MLLRRTVGRGSFARRCSRDTCPLRPRRRDHEIEGRVVGEPTAHCARSRWMPSNRRRVLVQVPVGDALEHVAPGSTITVTISSGTLRRPLTRLDDLLHQPQRGHAARSSETYTRPCRLWRGLRGTAKYLVGQTGRHITAVLGPSTRADPRPARYLYRDGSVPHATRARRVADHHRDLQSVGLRQSRRAPDHAVAHTQQNDAHVGERGCMRSWLPAVNLHHHSLGWERSARHHGDLPS